MCRDFSGLACRNEHAEISIITSDFTQSHTHLREAHHIHDTEARQFHGRSVVGFEFTPPADADGETIQDLSRWTLALDEQESAPDWWSEAEPEIWRQMGAVVRRRIIPDARGTVLGGCWIVAQGGRIAELVGGRIAWARNANLRNANLYDANLRDANLYSANLCNANLCNANLRDANLCNANLRNANLYNANLRDANLCNANLRDANLYSANLCNANLCNANLCNANLRNANLCNANLYNAQRLSTDLTPSGWRFSGGVLVRAEGEDGGK